MTVETSEVSRGVPPLTCSGLADPCEESEDPHAGYISDAVPNVSSG